MKKLLSITMLSLLTFIGVLNSTSVAQAYYPHTNRNYYKERPYNNYYYTHGSTEYRRGYRDGHRNGYKQGYQNGYYNGYTDNAHNYYRSSQDRSRYYYRASSYRSNRTDFCYDYPRQTYRPCKDVNYDYYSY